MLVATRVAKLVPGVPATVFEAASRLSASAASEATRNLDEHYFELQEQGSSEFEQVFAQARAAAAIGFAIEASPEEALYEAIIAIDNPERVHEILREVLGAPV